MDFKHAYNATSALRIKLCKECREPDELVAVASALAYQAAVIYEELAGPKHASQQFYHMADTYATKTKNGPK